MSPIQDHLFGRTRVKICCISSREEAALAVRLGADALGLVSAMPSGPGVIREELIADIAANVPPPVATFLLTSGTKAQIIIDQARRCRPTALQLVDEVPPEDMALLRKAVPWAKLVQVIHVTGDESVAQAIAAAPLVDCLLLDSGNPNLAVKELGGTGRIHNWEISRRIVESVDKPVFLAGGLNPQNAADAIRAVRPFGLDICSGVRTAGKLDENKLMDFMKAVGEA